MPEKQIFVAEVKTVSPFGFKSQYDEKTLQTFATTYGDVVAIHTDPRWGGDGIYYTLNEMAGTLHRRGQGQKLLAKGLHVGDKFVEAALKHRADYVLVVGRIPSKEFIDKCWLEPTNMDQLPAMLDSGAKYIVFNTRDLITGSENKVWDGLRAAVAVGYSNQEDEKDVRKHITNYFDKLRAGRDVKFIQASNIKKPADIEFWADGFIVGEHLAQFTVSRAVTQLEEHFARSRGL